jgi:hypothetical protein
MALKRFDKSNSIFPWEMISEDAVAPAASCEKNHRVKRAGWLSLLKRFLLATAAAGLIATSLPGGAAAEKLFSVSIHFYDNDDDEDYLEVFWDLDNPAVTIYRLVNKDGSTSVVVDRESNPGPDDPSSGPKGDRDSRIALAKQTGGGKWIADQYFWASELGKSLTGKGKGPKPVINPGDGDDPGGGPGNPSRGKEKLGKDYVIDHTGQLGSGKGGGFQFDGGSPGEQLKKGGGPKGPPGDNNGNGDDDDNDKGSNGPPPGTYFGPADLVDPLGPPIAKQAARPKTEKSGKARVQVTSKPSKSNAGPLTGKLTKAQSTLGQFAGAVPAKTTSAPTKALLSSGLLGGGAGLGMQGPAAAGHGSGMSAAARVR